MTWSLMPLGTLPAGALADHVGAPLTVARGGGLCAILVGVSRWLRRLCGSFASVGGARWMAARLDPVSGTS